jgi:hypothetical protein
LNTETQTTELEETALPPELKALLGIGTVQAEPDPSVAVVTPSEPEPEIPAAPEPETALPTAAIPAESKPEPDYKQKFSVTDGIAKAQAAEIKQKDATLAEMARELSEVRAAMGAAATMAMTEEETALVAQIKELAGDDLAAAIVKMTKLNRTSAEDKIGKAVADVKQTAESILAARAASDRQLFLTALPKTIENYEQTRLDPAFAAWLKEGSAYTVPLMGALVQADQCNDHKTVSRIYRAYAATKSAAAPTPPAPVKTKGVTPEVVAQMSMAGNRTPAIPLTEGTKTKVAAETDRDKLARDYAAGKPVSDEDLLKACLGG